MPLVKTTTKLDEADVVGFVDFDQFNMLTHVTSTDAIFMNKDTSGVSLGGNVQDYLDAFPSFVKVTENGGADYYLNRNRVASVAPIGGDPQNDFGEIVFDDGMKWNWGASGPSAEAIATVIGFVDTDKL